MSASVETQTPIKTPKRPASNAAVLSTPLFVPPSPVLKQLGYGTGVHIYRIERSPVVGKNRSPWVVKRLRGAQSKDEVISSRLLAEANILKRLDHPNIVGYRATKTLEDNNVALAMETCDTSLGDLLEQREELGVGPLEPSKIRKVCIDVCRALDYLHTDAMILHGDLKSYNVLIKNSFELCKLCDFGVSQPLNSDGYLDLEKHPDAKYVGTDIFSAPEVFCDPKQDISSKCDMFSFGLVVYECLTLRPPHYDRLEATNVSAMSFGSQDNSVVTVNDGEPTPKQKKLFEESSDDLKENKLSVSAVNGLASKETTLSDSAIDNSELMKSTAATMGDDTIAEISFESTSTDRQPMRDVSTALNSTLEETASECNSMCKSANETLEVFEPWYGTRPNVPDFYTYSDDYNVFFETFFMCTHALPEERPTAGDLLKSLETVLKPTEESDE